MFKSIFSKNQIDSLNAFYNSKSSVNAVYSEYTALLTDLGSPTVNVIYSNLGQIVTLTRSSTGIYYINVGGSILNQLKTYFSITNNFDSRANFSIVWDSTGRLILRTYYDGAPFNLLNKTPLTIRIYK